MPAPKSKGEFGLIFLDVHADYYQPSKSTTGEVADMDLAVVTGYGPNIPANIDGLKPYVRTRNVIHIGQGDAEEARRYGSRDIKDTLIRCFNLETMRTYGMNDIMTKVLTLINRTNI
jgi:arginase